MITQKEWNETFIMHENYLCRVRTLDKLMRERNSQISFDDAKEYAKKNGYLYRDNTTLLIVGWDVRVQTPLCMKRLIPIVCNGRPNQEQRTKMFKPEVDCPSLSRCSNVDCTLFDGDKISESTTFINEYIEDNDSTVL